MAGLLKTSLFFFIATIWGILYSTHLLYASIYCILEQLLNYNLCGAILDDSKYHFSNLTKQVRQKISISCSFRNLNRRRQLITSWPFPGGGEASVLGQQVSLLTLQAHPVSLQQVENKKNNLTILKYIISQCWQADYREPNLKTSFISRPGGFVIRRILLSLKGKSHENCLWVNDWRGLFRA